MRAQGPVAVIGAGTIGAGWAAFEGYASVADVERAVTQGLGPRWTVCGPHTIFHLAGGPDGMAGFLDRLGPAADTWWASLGAPQLDDATRAVLIRQMDQFAAGRSTGQLAAERDRQVVAVMRTIQSRPTQSQP